MRTTARLVATLLVAALVLGVLSIGGSWMYANRQLTGVGVAGLGDGPSTDAPDGTRNTLLVTGDGNGAEMVAIVQDAPGQEGPRVLFLPLTLELLEPGSAALTTVAGIRDDEGIELLVAAVEDYTGIPLHRVVDIDLTQVGAMVTSLGGINVCVPTTPSQVGETVKVSEECSLLDAAGLSDALALGDEEGVGLFDRFEIRRVLLLGLSEKMTTGNFLLHPLRSKAVAEAMRAAVFTDVDLGVRQLFSLAGSLDPETSAPVDVRVVPGFTRGDTGTVEPYPDQAESLFAALRDVTPLPAEIGIQPPTDLLAEDVVVLVLNGVGEPGLAGSMATFLKSRGFSVPEPGNLTEFDPSQRANIVRHTPAARPQAGLVADFLTDAKLEEVTDLGPDVPANVTVVVIVGSDWNG